MSYLCCVSYKLLFPHSFKCCLYLPMKRPTSLTTAFCLFGQYVLHGSDLRSLHQNIPPSVLPEGYGGTAGRLDMSAWSRLLLDCEEEFIVEFCQPDPLEGVVPPESMLFEGEHGGKDEDTVRGLRSQLYYCY